MRRLLLVMLAAGLPGAAGEADISPHPPEPDRITLVNATHGTQTAYCLRSSDGERLWTRKAREFRRWGTRGLVCIDRDGTLELLSSRTGKPKWTDRGSFGWIYPTGAAILVAGPEGIRAISWTGRRLWQQDLRSSVARLEGSLALLYCGTHMVGVSTRTGRQVWSRKFPRRFVRVHHVGSRIVIVCEDLVHAFDFWTGRRLATSPGLDPLRGDPRSMVDLDRSGITLIGEGGTCFKLALDDLSIVWKHKLDQATHLGFGVDGRTVLESEWRGQAQVDDRTGKLKWTGQRFNPALGQRHGRFLIASDRHTGRLGAMRLKDGKLLWQSSCHRSGESVGMGRGRIFTNPSTDEIAAVSIRSGLQLWRTLLQPGVKVIGTTRSRVYVRQGTSIWALRTTTGKILWKRTLPIRERSLTLR